MSSPHSALSSWRLTAFAVFPVVGTYLVDPNGWMLHLREISNYHLAPSGLVSSSSSGQMTMRNGEAVQRIIDPAGDMQLTPAVMGAAKVTNLNAPSVAGSGRF